MNLKQLKILIITLLLTCLIWVITDANIYNSIKLPLKYNKRFKSF